MHITAQFSHKCMPLHQFGTHFLSPLRENWFLHHEPRKCIAKTILGLQPSSTDVIFQSLVRSCNFAGQLGLGDLKGMRPQANAAKKWLLKVITTFAPSQPQCTFFKGEQIHSIVPKHRSTHKQLAVTADSSQLFCYGSWLQLWLLSCFDREGN